jgi:plasmid maintenance system killer protein
MLMAITTFGNKIADDIFHNAESKQFPRELWSRARQLLFLMDALDSIKSLETSAHPPAIRAHSLKGNMKGRIAIDIAKTSGWRITFIFENGFFKDVKIENYHK